MTNGDLEITLPFSRNEHISTPILLTIYGLSYLFFHKKVMKRTAYGFRDEKYLGYDYLPYMTVVSLEMSDEPQLFSCQRRISFF